ncbi:hypothetical protein JOD54_003393 [Actinokineospora baliensis]|nr:hypothetical protein [Actinokineospora baliensis]
MLFWRAGMADPIIQWRWWLPPLVPSREGSTEGGPGEPGPPPYTRAAVNPNRETTSRVALERFNV